MGSSNLGASLEVLDHQVSQWIISNVNSLESCRTKFCSINSLRFLHWAHDIYETSPIVASFCALNATEEAVAAFVAAAKRHGHKQYAKQVNLHNHHSKALVSVFAQRCSRVEKQGSLSIAVSPNREALAFRIPDGNSFRYGDLHLSSFRLYPNNEAPGNGDFLLGAPPSLEDIQSEIEKVAKARDALLYAKNTGLQTGFKEPQASLLRESQLSLGLIWGAVDIYMNPDQDRHFIDKILEEMASFNTSGKVKE